MNVMVAAPVSACCGLSLDLTLAAIGRWQVGMFDLNGPAINYPKPASAEDSKKPAKAPTKLASKAPTKLTSRWRQSSVRMG